jgi:peptidoglycan biosynthesis protein MviN/MurJ (putative lipid II flippase)
MRITTILTSLVVWQLIISLCSQLLILNLVGIGWKTDVFILAQTVPTIMVAFMASTLQSLWTPRFSRHYNEQKTWTREVSSALGQAGRLMLVLYIPLVLLADHWVMFVFPGLDDKELNLFVDLTYPLFFSSLFTVFSGILTAALRSAEKFLLPECITLIASVFSLIFIYFSVPILGVIIAAWIMAIKSSVVFLLLMHSVGWPKFQIKSGESSLIVNKQMKPLLYGSVLGKSGVLVDRYWGSQAPEGDVTILSVAQMGVSSASTVLDRVFLARQIPKFSIYIRDDNIKELRSVYLNGVYRIGLVAIALVLILILVYPAWPAVVNVALDMTATDAKNLWLILLALLPSVFSLIASSSSVAVFYAFGETKVPALIGAIGFILSMFLKALLYNKMGVIGIAVGSSCHLFLNFLFHFGFALHRINSYAKE